MASIPKVILLTLAEDNISYAIEDINIIYIGEDTLGAYVVYFDKGARVRKIIVTQTPDEIGNALTGLSDCLIPITHTNGAAQYINHRRIFDITPYVSDTMIRYNDEGARVAVLYVTESIADIQALIAAL